MTKKFWADWQKRFGETKNIYLFYKDSTNWNGSSCIFDGEFGDKLIHAKFYDNKVKLIIERKYLKTSNFSTFNHIDVETKTYDRNEIATIKFYKY